MSAAAPLQATITLEQPVAPPGDGRGQTVSSLVLVISHQPSVLQRVPPPSVDASLGGVDPASLPPSRPATSVLAESRAASIPLAESRAASVPSAESRAAS